MLAERERDGTTTPSQASKLLGVSVFTVTGMFGGFGKVAVSALTQRQHYDDKNFTRKPWESSPKLERANGILRLIFESKAQRSFQLRPPRRHGILLATDAQAEQGQQASGAYLAIDVETGENRAAFMTFSEETLEVWGLPRIEREKGSNPIAPCEAIMPLVFLMDNPDMLKGRAALPFIDNTSVLFGMIEGQSRGVAQEWANQLAHMMCYHLRLEIWWEFVPSEQNWADGASRHAAGYEWATRVP